MTLYENLTLLQASNKGADQPAHPHYKSDQRLFYSLSRMHINYNCCMQNSKLVSGAEQAGLRRSLWITPDRLLCIEAHMFLT